MLKFKEPDKNQLKKKEKRERISDTFSDESSNLDPYFNVIETLDSQIVQRDSCFHMTKKYKRWKKKEEKKRIEEEEERKRK